MIIQAQATTTNPMFVPFSTVQILIIRGAIRCRVLSVVDTSTNILAHARCLYRFV